MTILCNDVDLDRSTWSANGQLRGIMFKSTRLYQKIDETISWQRMPYITVAVVICCVFIYAYALLKVSVSDQQYQYVVTVAHQSQYPLTQRLAKQALRQPKVDQGTYFQLVRAYERERKSIQTYPAFDPTKPK